MGTQQILLIVISMIVIGLAVTFGITMFNRQSFDSNRMAVAAEMQQLSTNVIQYWKTPVGMGGAGQNIAFAHSDSLGTNLGFVFESAKSPGQSSYWASTSDNGEYRLIGIENSVVTFQALGVETKHHLHPRVETKIHLISGLIRTTFSEAEGF